MPNTAYVLTVKEPASATAVGFVPPMLNMNERAGPFLV